MLMGVLRQMDGSVHQGETKGQREKLLDSSEGGVGFRVVRVGVNWV